MSKKQNKSSMVITAVIYDRRGRVLSVGSNHFLKTHTLQAKIAKKVGLEHKIYLHAEMDAIIRCRHLDKAHRIFVSRYGIDGRPLNAKPCKICMEAITRHTPIKVIQYT